MGAAYDIMQNSTALANGFASASTFDSLEAMSLSKAVSGINTDPTQVTTPTWSTLKLPDLNEAWMSAPIYDEYDARHMELVSEIAQAFSTFIADYLVSPGETWAQGVLDSYGDVMTSMESKYWANDRNRILGESLRQQNAALAQSAGRGFPMPTGALNATLQEIRVTEMNKLAEVSHQAAIKHIDVALEAVKAALSAVVQSRQIALEAAIKYMGAMMMPAEIAAKFVIPLQSYRAQFLSAMAAYYNALISSDELRLRSSTLQANVDLGFKNAEIDLWTKQLHEQVAAASVSANAKTEVAQAALSSLNSIGSIAATE